MNQQQWHEWRSQGIGSSDAAVIMNGKHFGKDLSQLWEEKVLGVPSTKDNPSMQRGRELEEVARLRFEEALNVAVFPRNVEHPEKSWMRASLDGICLDDSVMVEIKCPGKEDHLVAVNKKVPEKYIAQCQHQLAVTGLDKMYYYSFDGSKGVIVEVPRDQKYIDEMIAKEKEFWDLVVSKTPPPRSEADYCDMTHEKKWLSLEKKWKETSSLFKNYESDVQALKEEFIALSNSHNAVGKTIKLSKSICKGNIDYELAISDYLDKIKARYPEIVFPEMVLEPYRKKSFTKWSIRDI